MSRIMILEDEPSLRRFLSIFVQSLGHTVIFEGGSGHVGLQHLARDPRGTDVILSDLRMPIADGLDVLAFARALKGAHARVILNSAHWTEEEIVLARDLGAFALLAKPFDLDLLAKTLATTPEGALAPTQPEHTIEA